MKIKQLICKLLAMSIVSVTGIVLNPIAIAASPTALSKQSATTTNSLVKWYRITSVDDLQKTSATQNIVFTFNPHFSPEQALPYLEYIPNGSLLSLRLESNGISTELNAKMFQKFFVKVKNQFGSVVILGQGIIFQKQNKNIWKILRPYKAGILAEYADPSVYYVIGKYNPNSYVYTDNPEQAQALGQGLIASEAMPFRRLIVAGNASNISIFSRELQQEKTFYDKLNLAFELQTMPTPIEANILANTIYYVDALAIDFNAHPNSDLIYSFAKGFGGTGKKMANTFGIGLPAGMDAADFSLAYDAYAESSEKLRPNKMFRIIGNTFRATDPGVNQYLFKNAIYHTQSLDPAWIDIIRANKLKGVSLFTQKYNVNLSTTIQSGLPYILMQNGSSKNIVITKDKKILQWYTGYVKVDSDHIKIVSDPNQLEQTLKSLPADGAIRIPSNLINMALFKQVTSPFIAVRDEQGDLIMKTLPDLMMLKKNNMHRIVGTQY